MQIVTAERLAVAPLIRSACFTARQAAKRPSVSAKADMESSRRESLVGVLAASVAAATLVAQPAQAILGIGEGTKKEDEYKEYTSEVIKTVQTALALAKDDPGRADAIGKVREETTKWVAKYRRDSTFQGRASYGNTYSALSALAGHYNSFGPETNVPKKRLDRLTKELADAEKLIARGR